MSGTCARCGRTLSEPTESCDCTALAPAAKAPRWGTLDIKLGDLQLPKARPANTTAPLDLEALAPRLERAAGAIARAATAPIATPAVAPGETSPSAAQAPAKRAQSAALSMPRADGMRRQESTKLDGPAPRPRRAHDGPTAPLDPRASDPRASAPRDPAASTQGHPAARNAERQHPALRNADAQHPALRGSAVQHPALRGSSPRAVRAITQPMALPLDAAPVAPPDPTTFGERFGDDSPFEIGSALEIETESPAREPDPDAAPAPPLTPSEPAAPSPAMQLAQLSGYGAPPQKLFQTVPYFFRVSARKRLLQAQLSAQSLQRKRSEQRADDAQTAMGEALYALRDDRRLQPLAAQLKLVHDARDQIGRNHAAAKRTIQTRKREFEALSQRWTQAKRDAEPFRERASALGQQIELGRAKLRDLEKQSRKLDGERKSLKGSNQVAALSQIATLDVERTVLVAAIQDLEFELAPAIEALAEVEKTLAEHDQTIARLEAQQRKTAEAAERDGDRQRITARSAANAYRETLRSLAQAAVRCGLGELAAPALRNASEAEAPIADERQSEEMLRRALASYDHAAYRRGMQIVAGAIVGTFMLFAMLIAF